MLCHSQKIRLWFVCAFRWYAFHSVLRHIRYNFWIFLKSGLLERLAFDRLLSKSGNTITKFEVITCWFKIYRIFLNDFRVEMIINFSEISGYSITRKKEYFFKNISRWSFILKYNLKILIKWTIEQLIFCSINNSSFWDKLLNK